jgi:hypothetical protein
MLNKLSLLHFRGPARHARKRVVRLAATRGIELADVVGEARVARCMAKLGLNAHVVVCKLAHLRVVDTEDLCRLVATEAAARDEVHDPKDDRRHHERVGHARDAIRGLVTELDPVVVEPPARNGGDTVVGGDAVLREEAGEEVAHNTANGVRREDLYMAISIGRFSRRSTYIETIVVTEEELELRSEVANRTSNNTEQDRGRATDEARRGGDRDKARDRAGAEADGRPLALETPIPEHPGEATDGRREVCHDARGRRTKVRGQGRATVEADPAEPEEHRAENDVRRVVRLVREALRAVTAALAEVNRDRERGGARANVHGGTAGKVETTKYVRPPVGVPGPTRNRVCCSVSTVPSGT